MIAVIGGSGFIGTRLCNRFTVSNVDFTIIDKNKSHAFPEKCFLTDIRILEKLEESITHQDTIVNLAAEHRDDVTPRSLYDEVNVEGAKNVCTIARKKNINKIIFTSSVAVYGFAPPDTDESGRINYFNDYGRTKWEAEQVYREWYQEAPEQRTLVIIRPTVVFGEDNRGNVYNLLKQMASGKFIMVGSGKNIKSMAYVENVAACLEKCIQFDTGLYVYNYIDKPDYNMNSLVSLVQDTLGIKRKTSLRLPFFLGYLGGKAFDVFSLVTKKKYDISGIRIKKFCSTTQFSSSFFSDIQFASPYSLEQGLSKTIRYEFLDSQKECNHVFYSE